MKLGLLLLALLTTTQLFGYFIYGGHLQSQSLQLLSNNLTIDRTDGPPSEVVLRHGVGQNEGRLIFKYYFFITNSEGGTEQLRISRWMTDRSTSDIFQAIGHEKGEVIGSREGVPNDANPFGAPLIIKTDDTKLTITTNYDAESGTGTMTIYGEKTLKDGRVIKWKDELS